MNKVPFVLTREFVANLLEIDAVERKHQSWKKISLEDAYTQFGNLDVRVEDDLLSLNREKSCGCEKCEKPTNSTIDFGFFAQNYCPDIHTIMGIAKNKIILAGGALYRSFNDIKQFNYDISDADFFFVDIEDPEALIRRICFFLKAVHGNKIFFVRNQNVTTVYITEHDIDEDDTVPHILWVIDEIRYKYQFIHRVYPSAMHVIGGFDLPSIFLDYNEMKFYTNTLGAFCIMTRLIIVDPSRRSLSYKSRILKYSKIMGCGIILTNFNKPSYEKIIAVGKTLKGLRISINVCKDISVEIKDPYRIASSLHGVTSNSSDYEENDITENETILVANSLAAVRGKAEQVIWFSFDPKELFDNPQIQHSMPIFMNRIDKKIAKGHIKPDRIKLNTKSMNRWGLFSFDKDHPDCITMDLDKYDELKNRLQEKIKEVIFVAQGRSKCINYIRNNPGRQWTSSLNPIYEDVRMYYHPLSSNIMTIGVSNEIFATIFLCWRGNLGVFKGIPYQRDVMNLLMENLRYCRMLELQNHLLRDIKPLYPIKLN